MATGKKDPEIVALEAVHSALKPLKPEVRRKVLASVFELLQISGELRISRAGERPSSVIASRSGTMVSVSTPRPTSLIELINEKRPGTNTQRLALLAYYREKSEGASRFSRDDLRPHFAQARIPPPANFDRDFTEAVKKGWIHEDKDESYLTSKGLEAVEGGFAGEPKAGRPAKAKGARSARKASARAKSRRR